MTQENVAKPQANEWVNVTTADLMNGVRALQPSMYMDADVPSPYNPARRFTNISKFAPDDSFDEWKHPALWTKEEIQELVMREVGFNTTSARGYHLLVKLWEPPRVMDCGLERTDHAMKKEVIQCTVGMILRMGADAFTDPGRFPSGPLVTYGEWGIFRGSERQQIGKADKRLALIHDDRFIAADSDPLNLITAFELEFEWANN